MGCCGFSREREKPQHPMLWFFFTNGKNHSIGMLWFLTFLVIFHSIPPRGMLWKISAHAVVFNSFQLCKNHYAVEMYHAVVFALVAIFHSIRGCFPQHPCCGFSLCREWDFHSICCGKSSGDAVENTPAGTPISTMLWFLKKQKPLTIFRFSTASKVTFHSIC